MHTTPSVLQSAAVLAVARNLCRLRAVAGCLVLLTSGSTGVFAGNEAAAGAKPVKGQPVVVHLRSRQETEPGSENLHVLTRDARWDPRKTAVIVCDMWDRHWCPDSTARVGEMAQRMEQVLQNARSRGMLIIHCPSGTLKFYEGTPQRKLAQQAPPVKTDIPLERVCRLDPNREGTFPIDYSDGGCDSPNPPKEQRVWTRQIKTLSIEPGDAITDSVEAIYLMRQRGIENVIVMGVHANICVLQRPFGIRQLVRQNLNVALMRDQTDTMYNPAKRPYVSHFTGTDLVIGHIERYWCPTITSTDLLGGEPFRFAADTRKHLVILIGEKEYRTDETLPPFALKQLSRDFRISIVHASPKNRDLMPGLEVLDDADVCLVSVRRRALPQADLKRIREYVASGRPLVGIRTSSHAFALRNAEPPKGHATWPQFDADVWGGHYTGHHPGGGPKTQVRVAEGAVDHPILSGLDLTGFAGSGTLYQTRPLADSTTALLMGSIPGQPSEPIAWTNRHSGGGRAFYTSLGHIQDFQSPAFQQLLRNAVYWAAGTKVPAAAAVASDAACE